MVYNLNVAITLLNSPEIEAIGASLFVPASARDLYEVVLDVQNFPRWAPGVRRVEVLEGAGGRGMVSEWEVSFLGVKRNILSVLEEAESPALLRWTYEGAVRGWGRCTIRDRGDGAVAEFRTELRPKEPGLEKLMRMPAVKGVASNHLKRCLARLGHIVLGDSRRVLVGPPQALE